VDVATAGGRFGAVLREFRLVACLTQEEVAHRSGLSVRAVSDLERGRTARPFGRTVRLLADALELEKPARQRLAEALRPGLGEADDSAGPLQHGRVLPAVVPRQLPAVAEHFTGRTAELGLLAELAEKAADGRCEAAIISAVGGTAGVGKTALAVHFGHQAAGLFPDGQLYVNLSGFSEAGVPLAPEQAIREFLDALGVPQDQIPASLDGQAALYRSLLAGRRVLVVLDNAADEQQVRPLLPGCAGCLVVATSRRQLTGLAAAEGAHLVTLAVLPPVDGIQVLAARLGTSRVAAEPDAAADLAMACAGLPLALAIAGARGAARPGLPLAVLAAELDQPGSCLDALDTGDPGVSIRPVFAWSYRALSQPAARMFRLLGLHPGPDISLAGAASLADMDQPAVRSVLGELAGASLLTEHRPGRYGLHDLLRAYATEQAAAYDGGQEQHAATRRLLDHYLHTGRAAVLLLAPYCSSLNLMPIAAGTRPEQPETYRQAMDWFASERRALLAITSYAAESGSDTYAWQIPWIMEPYLDRQGHWRDLATTQLTALAATERLGDRVGQAHVHRNIAHAWFWLGSPGDALAELSQALRVYQQLDDTVDQGRIHLDLTFIYDELGSFDQALDCARQALQLFQKAGDPRLVARALNAAGWCSAHLGRHSQALESCQQALELARQAGDIDLEALVRDSLGYIRHQLGNHAQAITCYQHALRIVRDTGEKYQQAQILQRLGDTWRGRGDLHAAYSAWQEALVILRDLGHHEAAQIQAKLASIPAPQAVRAPLQADNK
jgi:tetratricopeptide (TPR) repeat protein/transcriptional regulator with XRE-family HTH domain